MGILYPAGNPILVKDLAIEDVNNLPLRTLRTLRTPNEEKRS
jgi:hypothetical protein